MRHPTSLTVLSAPWTRSTSPPLCSPVFPTQSSSTPSLRPFKYHSLTGASLPPPAPLQTPRTNTIYTNMYVLQMCELHPTSLHFNPQPPSTSLHSTAVPFHSISSRSNPIHTIPPHFSRVRSVRSSSMPPVIACERTCMQAKAGKQPGRQTKAGKQIGNHQFAQTCRQEGGQAGKQASKQAGEHAGRQASRHAGIWVFVCLCFSSQLRKSPLSMGPVPPWEHRIPGDTGTKEPGDPRHTA